jgi:hypothetical protein
MGRVEGEVMAFKDADTPWVEALFDTSQPYLYLIVLPSLVLLALGFRNQALLFAFGAAVFLTVASFA